MRHAAMFGLTRQNPEHPGTSCSRSGVPAPVAPWCDQQRGSESGALAVV